MTNDELAAAIDRAHAYVRGTHQAEPMHFPWVAHLNALMAVQLERAKYPNGDRVGYYAAGYAEVDKVLEEIKRSAPTVLPSQ